MVRLFQIVFFLDTRIRVSLWLISSVELDSGLVPLPQALLALHTYSEVWLVWGLSLANLGSSKCFLCSAFRIGIFHCFCIEASHTYLTDFLFSCDYRIQLPPPPRAAKITHKKMFLKTILFVQRQFSVYQKGLGKSPSMPICGI